MKIALICNEYPPGPHGGIGTATRNLARALQARGHSVKVAGIYSAAYPAADYEEDQGVKVWRFRDVKGFGRAVRNRWRLFRIIQKWALSGEIDLVEVPDYDGMAALWPELPVPLVGRICGAVSYFQAELGQPVDRLSFWIEKRSLQRCQSWCAKSRYAARRAETFFALPETSVAFLYNPIPLPEPAVEHKRSLHDVVFANTLTAKKGIISLVRAWPRVLAARPDSQLHIYGKDKREKGRGSMEMFLSTLLNQPQRASVHFHGHVARPVVDEALARCRLAIFPSYAESFGNAPVEAMAVGCPTIYTRLSCGPEIVREDQDGLLVDPDNIPEISEAILRLLVDDNLCQRLGKAGRARVAEQFCPGLIAAQNESFYFQSIERFHAKHGFAKSRVSLEPATPAQSV